MKQSEAVFNATVNVMGKQDGAYTPTTEQRKQIIAIVSEGLYQGTVDFTEKAKAKYNSLEKIQKEYVPGLVSNWLRKDTSLNGGHKYVPTNPGSRTGSTDPQIKQARLLLKSGKLTEEQAATAQAFINERVAELKAEKSKVEIDMDAIPAELKAKLGL